MNRKNKKSKIPLTFDKNVHSTIGGNSLNNTENLSISQFSATKNGV